MYLLQPRCGVLTHPEMMDRILRCYDPEWAVPEDLAAGTAFKPFRLVRLKYCWYTMFTREGDEFRRIVSASLLFDTNERDRIDEMIPEGFRKHVDGVCRHGLGRTKVKLGEAVAPLMRLNELSPMVKSASKA